MLRFRNADGSVRVLTDPESVWRELHANVKGAFIHFLVHQKRDAVAILREWISASGGDDPQAWAIRKANGQHRHLLEFSDHQNMVRALFGEFVGRMALEDEDPLGRAVVQSRYIHAQLCALVDKLRMRLGRPDTPRALAPLLDPAAPLSKLDYQPLYRKPGAHIAKVLAQPDAYYFQDLVVTLHDVSGYMKKHAEALVQVPPALSQGTHFRINDLGEVEYARRPIGGTEDFRNKVDRDDPVYTLKENSGFIMAARVQGMPIWAGPSFTTGRMLRMAEWAHASAAELEALAWAIFGFWNQCYPTSSTWVHRFHEVMDMAANWGVPFTPGAYPNGIPPNAGGSSPKV